MKRRWQIIAVASGLIILAGLIYVRRSSRPKREATFRNQPISYWVQQHTRRPAMFDLGNFTVAERRQAADKKAQDLLAVGTNAIPALLDEIRHYGSARRSIWGGIVELVTSPGPSGGSRRRAQDVVLNATDALRLMGGEAIPILVQALNDRHPEVRQSAAAALGFIDPTEPRVNAALTACLRAWTNAPDAALGAMMALACAAPQASNLAPPLESIMQTEFRSRVDFVCQHEAAQALAAIAPDSAVLRSTLTNWMTRTNFPNGNPSFAKYWNQEASNLWNQIGAGRSRTQTNGEDSSATPREP